MLHQNLPTRQGELVSQAKRLFCYTLISRVPLTMMIVHIEVQGWKDKLIELPTYRSKPVGVLRLVEVLM